MKLFVLALIFCFAYPAMREFPPFHKLTSGPAPATGQGLLTRDEITALIGDAARKHKLPEALVKSIVAAESAFQSDAVSPKGALGLMQVMPETATEMGLDASVPAQNIEAGTAYLAGLVRRYQKTTRNWLKHAIAAYNAGPANVDHYRGVPPFRETRAYVARVLGYFGSYGGSTRSFITARR
jgi:soluble lytic murein transglycosylase-like protein